MGSLHAKQEPHYDPPIFKGIVQFCIGRSFCILSPPLLDFVEDILISVVPSPSFFDCQDISFFLPNSHRKSPNGFSELQALVSTFL